MFDVPYQVKHACGAGMLLIGIAVAGCAATDSMHSAKTAPFALPSHDVVPRVMVYGNLSTLLPHFEATPAIERFLYGPNDFGKTALRNPQGMTRCGDLLLVCDQGWPDIIAINLSTGQSRRWGDEEHHPRCPVDITTDEAGRIYVADTTLRSILIYAANQSFVRELKPPDEAFRPCAVLANANTIYIGNLESGRIDRWDSVKNEWLPPLSPPAVRQKIIAPTGLAVTPDGTLLIADSVQGAIFRVTAQGEWLSPIGKPGRGPGEFVRPKQVCCTSSGMILVTDAGRQSVLAFRADGAYITEIHEQPKTWIGFTLPAGILALRSNDLWWVNQCITEHGWSTSDEYVILSDALGGNSLTLIGIISHPPEVKADAG